MRRPCATSRFVRPALAVLLLGGFASPAFAHAMLRRAMPAVGATVQAAPAEIVLHFSEAVEPSFSSVEVHDANGVRVDAGDLHSAPGDAKTLVETLTARTAGLYRVEWHATSVDTHKTEGRFTYTVAP